MKETAFAALNEFCSANEQDYSNDADIRMLLKNGLSPLSMLQAARHIKRMENSVFLKLPVEIRSPEAEISFKIRKIPGRVLENKSLKIAAGCLVLDNDDPVMLRVSGPFSSFMSAAGTNTTYRWLQKNGGEVKETLALIADGLSQYIIDMAEGGVRIVSMADPSGIIEILGEKKYREFVAEYMIRLLKKTLPHAGGAIIHLCPKSSLPLQEFGYLTSRQIAVQNRNYAHALLDLPRGTESRLIGHRCINAENTPVGKMTFLDMVTM